MITLPKYVKFLVLLTIVFLLLCCFQLLHPSAKAYAGCSIEGVSPNPANAATGKYSTLEIKLKTNITPTHGEDRSNPMNGDLGPNPLYVTLVDSSDPNTPIAPTVAWDKDSDGYWIAKIDLNTVSDKAKLKSGSLVITARQPGQDPMDCTPTEGWGIKITTGGSTGVCEIYFDPTTIDDATDVKFGVRNAPSLKYPDTGVLVRVFSSNGTPVKEGQVHIADTNNSYSSFQTKLAAGSYYAILYSMDGNSKYDPECRSADLSVSHKSAGVSTFVPGSSDVPGFASKFASIAIGIAGGVAFLLMIYGSFRLVFSNGDVEAVQQGRQIIVAAVTGLIVVVFSVFLLHLIGISILGLPI